MFAEACDAYYSKGISVIPADGKRVPIPNFGRYSHQLPKPGMQELFKLRYSRHNLGVMMGPVNGLMVLDVDTDLKEVMDYIERVSPKTNVKKFGSKGMTLFYRTVRKKNEMYVSKEKGCMLEFLCTSKYTVVPPSIHPTTKEPYTWVGQDLVSGIDDLPEISEDALEKIDEFMRNEYDCLTLREIRGKQ